MTRVPTVPHSVVLDLGGRTAVVTGASSGIGRACALRLAGAGAAVRAVDRDPDGLDDLVTRARAEGLSGPVEPLVVDLTDLDAAERTAGGCDIVVNNAGTQLVRPIEEFPPDAFAAMLRLMLEAPFRLVRAALPHMYGQGWGRILNITSVHGLRASPYKSAYTAAKHGLEGFSKAAALEGAAHGVTSNCISPAYVRTPLVERQIDDLAAAHGITRERVIGEVMLADAAIKRLIEPAEVAELAAFLCTPGASFITGVSLTMDGGWTAH